MNTQETDILFRKRIESLKWPWAVDRFFLFLIVPILLITGLFNLYFIVERILNEPGFIGRIADSHVIYKFLVVVSLCIWFTYAGMMFGGNIIARMVKIARLRHEYKHHGDTWCSGDELKYRLYPFPRDMEVIIVRVGYAALFLATPPALFASYESNPIFLLAAVPLVFIVATKLREFFIVSFLPCPKIEIDTHPLCLGGHARILVRTGTDHPENCADIVLLCEETIEVIRSKHNDYHCKELYRATFYSESETSSGGQPRIEVDFAIPANVSPTQTVSLEDKNGTRTVRWMVEITQIIRNRFSRVINYELVILPKAD